MLGYCLVVCLIACGFALVCLFVEFDVFVWCLLCAYSVCDCDL